MKAFLLFIAPSRARVARPDVLDLHVLQQVARRQRIARGIPGRGAHRVRSGARHLWVVCRSCERWNLSPLDERWEAIEQAEKFYRDTRRRVSTDNVGLAKLRDGSTLVRIGDPLRPEFAAWRYGDQFGRRRRKRFAMVGGAAVIVGGVILAGPVSGLVGASMFNPVFNLFNAGRGIYRSRTRLPIALDDGTIVPVSLAKLGKVTLKADKEDIVLELKASTPWWHYDDGRQGEYELHGDVAIRAAAVLLPHMNLAGGSRKEVSVAVDVLERAGGDPSRLFRNTMSAIDMSASGWRDMQISFSSTNRNTLSSLPTTSTARPPSSPPARAPASR